MPNITDCFKDKTLVITGGTGSFGFTVLKHRVIISVNHSVNIELEEEK